MLFQGKKGITRNGYLPERDIQTGIGPFPVRAPPTEIDKQMMNRALFDINHPHYLQTFFDSWMITFVVLLEFIKGIEWPMNSDHITEY